MCSTSVQQFSLEYLVPPRSQPCQCFFQRRLLIIVIGLLFYNVISSSDLAFETLKEYDIFYFKIESIALLELSRSPAILQTELWEQQPQVAAWEIHVGWEENLLPQEGSAAEVTRGDNLNPQRFSRLFLLH